MDNIKLTLGVGLAQEIEHALNRNGFQSLEEVKALTVGDFLGRVRGVQLGLYEIKPIEHAIDLGADPYLPDGWKVEEHQSGKVAKLECRGDDLYLDGKKIEFWLSKLQKKGNAIRGNDLRKELAKQRVLNANVLDYLLKNPHLIPEAWKKDENGNTRYIFFWGTIYRGADDDLYVRCLRWGGGRWGWNCRWLDNDFRGLDPAAVSAS
ncbi:MAG: hypothetical protein WCW03_02040 [Candidatus Paceibacterota bacterium]|jgi:hypothetical protein